MIDLFGIGYIALMIVSFLSATILPFGSEPLFIAMVIAKYDAFLTILIASIFNTLGGMTNYFLGKLGKIELVIKYTKIKKEKLYKLQKLVKKYGAVLSLLTWLPYIGDPLAAMLGLMNVNKWLVFSLMLLSKTIRYIILWYMVKYANNLIKINLNF